MKHEIIHEIALWMKFVDTANETLNTNPAVLQTDNFIIRAFEKKDLTAHR